MSNRLEEAVQRLRMLAETSDKEADGLSISSMIEAVVGPAFDEELEGLVTIALKNNPNGLSLDDIANGILSLEDWRVSQT